MEDIGTIWILRFARIMHSFFSKYTMHNKLSNFLCFASFLCSSLCSPDQFQLQ